MSTVQTQDANAATATIDLKLEVVVLPVADAAGAELPK